VNPSDALENIATEPPEGSEGAAVRFTVPVSSFEPRDGVKRTRLLRVEFDPPAS
jgi:hypothetical protein